MDNDVDGRFTTVAHNRIGTAESHAQQSKQILARYLLQTFVPQGLALGAYTCVETFTDAVSFLLTGAFSSGPSICDTTIADMTNSDMTFDITIPT